MAYLLDTNILLRLRQTNSPQHQNAFTAIRTLKNSGQRLCIVPQNLIEYWVVATRPADVNGFGLEVAQVFQELEILKQLYTFYLDLPEIYEQWSFLVKIYQVKGKTAHDARLVAAMLTHRIENILTFNIADFRRYSEINAVNPSEIY